MARQPVAKHICEADEDATHYTPPLGLDQVTLCGMTDWIGQTRGEETTNIVDCRACLTIVNYIQSYRFD